jgi:hypothetical protein
MQQDEGRSLAGHFICDPDTWDVNETRTRDRIVLHDLVMLPDS